MALCTALAAALATGWLPLIAEADDAAPPSAAAAAASSPAVPSALRTPAERREQATAPELRPEQAALPQLSIPLGRSAPVSRPPEGLPLRGAGAASSAMLGGVNDAAARCEAKPSAAERASCRVELAHEFPHETPHQPRRR